MKVILNPSNIFKELWFMHVWSSGANQVGCNKGSRVILFAGGLAVNPLIVLNADWVLTSEIHFDLND